MMQASDVDFSHGLNSDRLADQGNYAELIYAQTWRGIHCAGGIPVDIYPAGAADDRLGTVCATLAQWLGTSAGQAHIQTATEAGTEDELDFWHSSPDEIFSLAGCQDTEMAFGFFEWLSSPDGVGFIAQCQERITAFT